MPKFIPCLLVLALLATTATARAQQAFDPAARASRIAPFIDEQTILVVHLDLSKIQVGPLLGFYADVLPIKERQLAQFRKQTPSIERASQAALGAFTEAGGRDLYVVLSLFDVAGNKAQSFMIVPLAEDADVPVLCKVLKGSLGFSQATTEKMGNALFVGRPDTLERLEHMKPDPRPDLVPAFEAAGDTTAQVVVLPPRHTRRVLEEMTPTLPELLGGGPSTVLTRGILWASVGADMPPKFALRAVVQSQDPAAASALLAKLNDLIRAVAQREDVRKAVPNLVEIASLLLPSVEENRLVLNMDDNGATIESLLKALRSSAVRVRSVNNLKQIGLAFHNYHATNKSFPARANYDADGKPLLSWRVHILPYLEHQQLYDQFHLNEPWDSEPNRKLIERMPSVFRSPGAKLQEKGHTSYLVPVGAETVFSGKEGSTFERIGNTTKTVLAVEVDDAHAVIWTKPADLSFDPQKPLQGLGGPFAGGFHALFCDDHVEFRKLTEEVDEIRGIFVIRPKVVAQPASNPSPALKAPTGNRGS